MARCTVRFQQLASCGRLGPTFVSFSVGLQDLPTLRVGWGTHSTIPAGPERAQGAKERPARGSRAPEGEGVGRPRGVQGNASPAPEKEAGLQPTPAAPLLRPRERCPGAPTPPPFPTRRLTEVATASGLCLLCCLGSWWRQ